MTVFRIYVEKKRAYNVEAENLAKEIRDFLKIPGLMDLRIVNRYDIEGINEDLFQRSKDMILSSPVTDELYDRLPSADYIIAMESLPGQFDQRADSAAHMIQLLSKGELPRVRTARILLLFGELAEKDIDSIENYIINPIESRKAQLEAYESLLKQEEVPKDVETMEGFINMSLEEGKAFLEDHNLAMDLDDLLFCRDYFNKEGRDPSYTEIRMIDTYWSDHCRHTTFLTEIDSVTIEDENVEKSFKAYLDMRSALGRKDKPITLMDIATIGARYLKHTGKLNTVDESEEVNACSVKVEADVDGIKQPWLLMFKNETHNHPTEIEPFGGASTCLGGAIRDPLSGRSYVYHAMRITGAADPLAPVNSTIEGKLPQRKIVKQAAKGYSSYGNQIGLAAGLVNEIYHPGYAAKRMEMGAVVAAAPAENVVRKVPVPGDVVILLGGKTGRDGCGGATGSSKSHDSSSLEKGGAEVQKGNAPEERKIQRLFRNEELAPMIKRCNDFGAGGVSVAVGELADSLEIDLDAVPVKYRGLDGTELAISESQERMAVVVAAEDAQTFIKYADEENLQATIIASVTDSGRLIMKWRGKKIVDISREFLSSNGVSKHTAVRVAALKSLAMDNDSKTPKKEKLTLQDIIPALTELVSDLNVCSQKGLSNIFDSTAGANTVLMPLGGIYQETPAQVMVAKLPVLKGDTSTCSATGWGFDPYFSEKNPYIGSYYAVVESVAKLVAAGGDINSCWLSFQEFFERLGNDPDRWGKPFSALLGALDAQRDLSLAAIGGKDSMSGSFEDLDVPPTLVSVAVSLCHGKNVISPEFKEAGNKVLLISPKYDGNGLPEKESLLDCFSQVARLIKGEKIVSAYAITSGGPAEAIFKMSLGNRLGLDIDSELKLEGIFDGRPGSFVVEWKDGEDTGINDMPGVVLGKTIEEFAFTQGKEKISIKDLRKSYNDKLEGIFPTECINENDGGVIGNELAPNLACNMSQRKPLASGIAKISGKPSVLIPVFPGSGGEYEAAKMIEDAGGKAEVMIFNNRSSDAIKESLADLAERIEKTQIILLSGGMPFGDEPDGGGKALAAILKMPELAEAITAFLEDRQGLMLGLGDGFRALLKTGLLPYGRFTELNESDPDFAINPIGAHQSTIVNTKICSNFSPWLENTGVGDIYPVPVSFLEGRFSAGEKVLKELVQNGQIAAQYVDFNGEPSMDIRFNPGRAAMAIEAITSPDGRILGRMGQFERLGKYLYKNIPGMKEYNIFESAIGCFK